VKGFLRLPQSATRVSARGPARRRPGPGRAARRAAGPGSRHRARRRNRHIRSASVRCHHASRV